LIAAAITNESATRFVDDGHGALRAVPVERLADWLERLRNAELAGPVTDEALGWLPDLFGEPSAEGVALAVRVGRGCR
jgi:hypothetical protein